MRKKSIYDSPKVREIKFLTRQVIAASPTLETISSNEDDEDYNEWD